MKRISLLLLAVMAGVSAMTAATRLLKVNGNPEKIEVSTALDVTVKESQSPAQVTITGPDKAIIDLISVTMKGKSLVITTLPVKGGGAMSMKGVKVVYEGVMPTAFSASASADIDVVSPVNAQGKTVAVNASSSGDVNLPAVTATSIAISASSSGDVEITSAIAEKLALSASSSADVEIKAAKATSVAVNASSNADVELKGLATNNLAVSASSGAEVELAGSAVTAVYNASSGATIDPRSLKCTSVTTSKSSGGSVK